MFGGRDSIDRIDIIRCVNRENACGTGVFIDLDNHARNVFAHFLHQGADALSAQSSACVTRSLLAASTLP
jgi:hypothetical protein